MVFAPVISAEPPDDYFGASAVIDMMDNPFGNLGNFHIYYDGQTERTDYIIYGVDTEMGALCPMETPNGEEYN